MIRESKDILGWIVEQGVRWQPSLGGTLSLGPDQLVLPWRRQGDAERALSHR